MKMYQGRHAAARTGHGRARGRKTAGGILLIPVLLLLGVVIGGTLAYLTAESGAVVNTFAPAEVDCQVTETFDGTEKENVNVRNTGNTDAFLRVRLVTYRVNDDGERIGGTAAIPAFTPGTGWVAYGSFYYYTLPVAPGGAPAADLIDRIPLTVHYGDADGGRQVIQVLAEAIQSEPALAVQDAWGVTIANGTVTGANP